MHNINGPRGPAGPWNLEILGVPGVSRVLGVMGLGPTFPSCLWQRYFPVKFENFPRTPFLQNTSGSCFWVLCRITVAYLGSNQNSLVEIFAKNS